MFRRKIIFMCAVAFFFGSLFTMFKQLDRQQGQEIMARQNTDGLLHLGAKLSMMEHVLKQSRHTMDKLRSGLDNLVELSRVANVHAPNREEVVNKMLDKDQPHSAKFPSDVRPPVCQKLNYIGAKCDIEMNSEYGIMDWADNIGGVWKQGFNIHTNDEEWINRTLKIHLVPHSHNDPGWLKTYEDYFYSDTKFILDNIVDHLSMDPKRRFIWAEISYLSMWYDNTDDVRRENIKKLIKNGQLEIVTGGWVMNDEANTHYFAIIDQMIEGHEWLAKTFGVVPRSGWAIDPFGHTPTMAYLLKRMGLSNMVIQRVHYSVKKHLAEQTKLEFRWRQEWDSDSSTDITCHMMPFYSYDVPHTCGPDPSICCQFDFGRLRGMRRSCPWGSLAIAIDDTNVNERARTLLDQYRKKSKLFKTDTLLVILGDDFRYQTMAEVEAQFSNYAKLFDYINSHPELHAEAKFSTLTEYFDAMLEEVGGAEKLPSLSGDFFTYADRQDHYWSGYYTSRPFYKTQERNLERHLRGAEILFSLALPVARSAGVDEDFSKAMYPLLRTSRQNLGLFQHHDGITGTSKSYVVNDYGKKLQTSIMNAKTIISRSAELLLLRKPSEFKASGELTLNYDAILASQDKSEEKVVIQIDKLTGLPTTVVIYNSLSHNRVGLVRVVVTTPHVKVTNSRKEDVPSQTNLIWVRPTIARLDQFELVFVATVAATGLATYKISYLPSTPYKSLSKVTFLNVPPQENIRYDEVFSVERTSSPVEEFSIENEQLVVSFNTTNGLMKTVWTKRDNVKMKVDIDFGVYDARGGRDRSGAYLFLPAGPAKPYLDESARPVVRIIKGPLLQEVQVLLSNVEHTISLHNTNNLGTAPFGIFVRNKVDLRSGMDNKEISMRITAPDASDPENVFFTDLNGLQMQKRKTRLNKIPLQANFYPMPTMAFIQNEKARLSIMTAQPRGVASLIPSQIEIILDRRMMQDDHRGMGQAMNDNVATCDNFVILIEKWRRKTPELPDMASENHFASVLAHHTLLDILHPVWVMPYTGVEPAQVSPRFGDKFTPLPGSDSNTGHPPLPCSIHILNLRSIESRERNDRPSEETALILQNFGHECHMDTCAQYKASCLAGEFASSFSFTMLYPVTNIKSTSLSLQYDEDQMISSDADFTIQPMEIKSFKIKLR